MTSTHKLARPILFASALALGACRDAAEPVAAPASAALATSGASAKSGDRVAFVQYEGRFPALYIQNVDGSDRQRVRFVGVYDRVEGNYSRQQLPVTDESIIAMGPLKFSPDGSQLAVVLSVGFDQSEVVVMNADGHNIRVASPNGAYILSDVDWSPDGKWIAYGMATLPGARGVELFATDLRSFEVQQLTRGAFFGVRTELRWNEAGTGLFLSEITSEEKEPPFNYVNRVRLIDLATHASQTVAEGVVGDMLGLTRSGKHALMTRRTLARDGSEMISLQMVELSTGRGTELQAGSNLWTAELLSGEREALVISNVSSDPYSTVLGYALQPLAGGRAEQLPGIPGTAWVADITK